MEIDEDFLQIDLAYLSGVVGAAYHNPQLVINDWQVQRLHGGFQLNSSIYRLLGHASDSNLNIPWSFVVKVIQPDPIYPNPQDYRYWEREPLAYRSGALNDLTGLVVAPRCYDVCAQPDSSLWIFMEDIHEEIGKPWSLDQYAAAARCLGEFNGAYLAGRPLPEGEWVARDWLRNYLQHAAPAVDFIRKHPHDPLITSIFPGTTLAQTLAFWDLHPRLLKKLDTLPQAFCHQDAFDRNLFLHHDQVVAIDWGYTGIAPVGAELTPLIAAAIGMGGFPASRARELDSACFMAYIEGLNQAGYQADTRQVRLGFTLTLGLRYILGNAVGETIPSLLDPERRKRIFEVVDNVNPENLKSDPGNVTYLQGIVFEMLRQLGLGFTLQMLARTLGYFTRWRI
jgi:hypothetical protein